MSRFGYGPVHAGPPAPYPAVQDDPVVEQWWWDHLKRHPFKVCHCQGLSHRNDCPEWELPL